MITCELTDGMRPWAGDGQSRTASRNRSKALLVVVALGILPQFGSVSLAAEPSVPTNRTLTIGADVWCPINCEPGDPHPGIAIDLARKVFEPLGYKVEYVVLPWGRALAQTLAGEMNAAVGAAISDEPRLLFPRHPIRPLSDTFYVKADSTLRFETVDSLKGHPLGIVRDYGYSEELTAFIEQNRHTPDMIQAAIGMQAAEQNIRKLLAGRIDVMVDDPTIVEYVSKREGVADRIKAIGAIAQGNVYLAFSPALPESHALLDLYDKGIDELERTGGLATIYAAYGLTPP